MRQLLIMIAVVLTSIGTTAQTLKVQQGSVTYAFAANSDEMTYTDNGQTLTIQGKSFSVSDITGISIDDTEVSDSVVTVVYDGTSASVTIAGDIANDITATVSGAHVKLEQSKGIESGDGEVEYVLSGTSTDGEFALEGTYKCTVSLAGLELKNPSGAAINIGNSKRIQLSAKKGTVNTLTDGADGSQKACIYSKGQLQLQGNGTLNVAGNTKHAIKSGDYITVKNLTLNITSAVGDGINCEEYFQMKSGVITISGTGDDGIQCDLGGDSSTGETNDHDGEDSGNVYIDGGTLTVGVTAAAAKGVKSDGDLKISAGTLNITTTGGGAWDTDDKKTKASTCLSADGNIGISGGTMTLTSKGAGGKGISGDGELNISGGDITVNTSGGIVAYVNNKLYDNYSNNVDRLTSDYKSSPKGIKIDGAINISGGNIYVKTTGKNGEGIESKKTMEISGGNTTVESYDDGLNASSDLTISGGKVYSHATNNDGIDANGNCYIKGGLIFAIGTSTPEVGIDANSEEQKKLYVTGGTIIAIGGLESGSSLSQSCYSSSSWTKNTWYAMTYGDETVAFKTPSSGGSTLVVSAASTPTLKSGVTVSGGTEFWNGYGNIGGTISGGSSVNLSEYTSSGGFGPGGGGFPGGGGWRW